MQEGCNQVWLYVSCNLNLSYLFCRQLPLFVHSEVSQVCIATLIGETVIVIVLLLEVLI